jgi:transcriptional regulator GlxA family with amidase domain
LVLLRGIDDDAGSLRAIVRAGGATSATTMLLHRLAKPLGCLPPDLQLRCTSMLGGVAIPGSVMEFAAGGHLNTRTMQRHFLEAGLGTPSHFLRVMRVVRTWDLLKDRTTPMREVAKACGFPSEKALRTQFSMCISCPPRRAIRQLTAESFVDRLMDALTRPEFA